MDSKHNTSVDMAEYSGDISSSAAVAGPQAVMETSRPNDATVTKLNMVPL